MLKLSNTLALAALISIASLSNADASKSSFEDTFLEQAASVQYRTNRSGLVRGNHVATPQTDIGEDEHMINATHNASTLIEDAEEAQSQSVINRVFNFFTNLFWRS